MNLLNIYKETISDGAGLRYSIYLSGCTHACPGCHNPKSWDPEAGIPLSDEMLGEIIREIRSNPLLDGITISGGDPFYNPDELTILLKRLKEETDINIWCYTGYTLEYLLSHDRYRAPLRYIDILVDGPFVQSLFDPTLSFRGSSNQRIIQMKDIDLDTRVDQSLKPSQSTSID